MDNNVQISPNPFVISRTRLASFGVALVVVFCSALSHTVISIPPTVVFFFIGSFTLALISFSTGKVYNPSVIAFPLCCAVYYAVSQTIIGAPVGRFMGVVLSILYFVVIASYGNLVPEEKRTKYIRYFIILSVCILVAECIWRLTHPEEDFKIYEEMGDPRWIYQYKFGGLMYVDSNAVAIHIVIVLFYILYRQVYFKERHATVVIILLILLFFTISRAAWIGTFIGFLYLRYLHKKGSMAFITGIGVVVIILTVVAIFLAQEIRNDLSFISKTDILKTTVDYFSRVSTKDLFFGVGFSNSEQALGVYAHNFIMVFLIESGIIGLTFIFLLFVYFINITGSRAYVILIPFLITTLSATITFIPYFYLVMALLYIDNKNSNTAK